MDCGIPFCHKGCPLGNIIPDWNDLVYRGRWKEAIDRLHSTNNFPEFTGRICPAPCEEACVLGINDDPVTIKQIEKQIIDHALQGGLDRAAAAARSAPARRSRSSARARPAWPCAQQLARAGHLVTVFERADRIGGLLRYGIPDFKMEKHLIDRRMEQMEAEGVTFQPERQRRRRRAGRRPAPASSTPSCWPAARPGRATCRCPAASSSGIHFAMDFLPQQNKVVAGDTVAGPDHRRPASASSSSAAATPAPTASAPRTARARVSVHQFELLPQPPDDAHGRHRAVAVLADDPAHLVSSHEEGVIRDWSINTKTLLRRRARQRDRSCTACASSGCRATTAARRCSEIPGSEFELDCDLVLLALGFLGPEQPGLLTELGVELDERGNVAVDANYMSSVPGVFACGDMRRGQSLVVWAIWEGRECARGVDAVPHGPHRPAGEPDPF